ncbi:hypothetical protein CKO09_02925 [Chromatium weissei]|nr:hypothetical protein [Chromatium weissei]
MSEYAHHLVSTFGLVLDIIGAWLVAYEVVNQYRGQQFEKSQNTPTRRLYPDPAGNKTKEYNEWEKSKLTMMSFGLVLLTLGFAVQIAGVWIS